MKVTDAVDMSTEKIKNVIMAEKNALDERDQMAKDELIEDKEDYEKTIEEYRVKTLWDIKELVFQLGYTQGYHYGSHDGKDQEIKAEITLKK